MGWAFISKLVGSTINSTETGTISHARTRHDARYCWDPYSYHMSTYAWPTNQLIHDLLSFSKICIRFLFLFFQKKIYIFKWINFPSQSDDVAHPRQCFFVSSAAIILRERSSSFEEDTSFSKHNKTWELVYHFLVLWYKNSDYHVILCGPSTLHNFV